MNLSIRSFDGSDRVWAEPFLFPDGPPFRYVRRGVLDGIRIPDEIEFWLEL